MEALGKGLGGKYRGMKDDIQLVADIREVACQFLNFRVAKSDAHLSTLGIVAGNQTARLLLGKKMLKAFKCTITIDCGFWSYDVIVEPGQLVLFGAEMY